MLYRHSFLDVRDERVLQFHPGRVPCVAAVTVGSFARVSSDVGVAFIFVRVFGDCHHGSAVGVDSFAERRHWSVVRLFCILCADGRVHVWWELSETVCDRGFEGSGEGWNV